MNYNETELLLQKIKNSITDYYFIFSNNEKNYGFCSYYSLNSKIIKNIIKGLTIYDLVKVTNSNSEKVYLFVPNLKLVGSNGSSELIRVYFRIKFLDNEKVIIIDSLFRCDYILEYAF